MTTIKPRRNPPFPLTKQEEELRLAMDPKYKHLNDELHVEISALAPPAEAHARAAYALAEVRKYLIPDSNDMIRQEQWRELITDGAIVPPASSGGSAHHHAAYHHSHHLSSAPSPRQHSPYQPATTPPPPPAVSRNAWVNPYARPRAIASAYAAAAASSGGGGPSQQHGGGGGGVGRNSGPSAGGGGAYASA